MPDFADGTSEVGVTASETKSPDDDQKPFHTDPHFDRVPHAPGARANLRFRRASAAVIKARSQKLKPWLRILSTLRRQN